MQFKHFNAPFRLQIRSGQWQIRDANGMFITETRSSTAPHIDSALKECMQMFADAPSVKESHDKLLSACETARTFIDSPDLEHRDAIKSLLDKVIDEAGKH